MCDKRNVRTTNGGTYTNGMVSIDGIWDVLTKTAWRQEMFMNSKAVTG